MSKTDILSVTKKRGSSISQLSKLYSGTIPNVGCGRFCRVDYLSVSGKWLTFSKLMALVLIPVLAGWAFTMYSLADTIQTRDNTVDARVIMTRAINLGRIIYKLQKERDMSILYLSRIGPVTKLFVIREYENTDTALAAMWDWPEEFANHPNQHLRTKNEFINYIQQHRTTLEINSSRAYDEILFYTELVDFMMDWMITSIKESGFSNVWRLLVVFHKITRCMLDTGIERAFGAMFFAQGNFPDINYFGYYFRRIHRFNYSYKSATYYSDLIDTLVHDGTEQRETTTAINTYRQKVKFSNVTGLYTSAKDALFYFDNMTIRVDYMFKLQNIVSQRVVHLINATLSDHVTSIIIYGVIAGIVIMSCPVIIFLTEALISHIQRCSQILVKATDDLDVEKCKTDSILHQMLPKTVVKRLKVNSKVDSEYYQSATIMFSSIVNFTRLSIEVTPMDLIECLNALYTAIDEKVEAHGVYKVETINDTYMVVSGVPVPNGMKHASEIAYLALAIRDMTSHAVCKPSLRMPIELLLGISTGSVSAGVVGTVMLRYCLFGDTVNTASRMKSYSQPNRIHISDTTYRNLVKTGNFRIQNRGQMQIKGKGGMETYWLMGTKGKPEVYTTPSNIRLPGALSDISNDDSSSGPGPSTQEVMCSEKPGGADMTYAFL